MNILTDELPCELVVAGEVCKIRYDFKTWIKFANVMSEQIPFEDKLIQAIKLVFYDIPPSLIGAISALQEFFNPCKSLTNNKSKDNGRRIYDFNYDAELIFAAFFQQYKIDLSESNMHWHKFKMLFDNLTDDTKFIKVIQYRCTDLNKIKDKEQKKFYREMKRLYRLPDNRTEKQKEEDFIKTFADSFI